MNRLLKLQRICGHCVRSEYESSLINKIPVESDIDMNAFPLDHISHSVTGAVGLFVIFFLLSDLDSTA